MHLKSAIFCLSAAALLGSALASPAVLQVNVPKSSKRQVQEINAELGCSAKGPLTGPWAIELFTCQTDSNYTCQATESTGCSAGDASGIDMLMVLDSTTGTALGAGPSIAETYFTCPENGLVQCVVHFANNGSDASSYGLRVINATEDSPFYNSTFGAPAADNSTTDTDTDTDSFGESATDSSFGEPTDSSDSGFGSTDSGTDSGFGSPTDSSSDDFGGATGTSSDFSSPSSTDSGFGSDSTDTDTDSDTVLAGSSNSPFSSTVVGDDASGDPVATSTSFSTSSSGFGSAPTDEVSGFS